MKTAKSVTAISVVCFCFATFSSSAATFTVAKDGTGMYTSIQAAINAAGPGDVVKILDAGTYAEQVTINESKTGLTLTSSNPASLSKPRIVWKDQVNQGPKTCAEAQIDTLVTFDQNGALRLMRVRNVQIHGITVDGGGPMVFGSTGGVWRDGRTGVICVWPNLHGNAAILVWLSGGAIIRNCEAQNAYFGVYLKDRNIGGIFANSNPGDLSGGFPGGFGRTGNHVVEYSRIHNNSYGIFVESAWDLGSTIRYNLIYENHHQTEIFAASVKAFNGDGNNQPGGAIWFKDDELSPFAIYNNTFWHNFIIFVGTYQAGYQHLVFNNIFGRPNRYWEADPNYPGSTYLDINPSMPNRITNCVYSRQAAAPAAGPVGSRSVIIMNGLPIIQGPDTSRPVPPGTLIASALANKAFPVSANNRWLEMDTSRFISVDPASADFLTPKWTDSLVQKYIKNQGWQKSGVKNLDGAWADLGAIPSSGGNAADLAGTVPVTPVLLPTPGNSATVNFTLASRIGTFRSPKFTFLRWVGNLKYIAESWASGNAGLLISNTNINDVAIPATPVKVGANSYTVTLPGAQTSDYGFFEAMFEGTGEDGRTLTSAVCFLPYRNGFNPTSVEIIPHNPSATLSRKPKFSWHPVQDAKSYTIQIATRNSFSADSLIVQLSTNDTTFVPSADLPLGLMYWRVKSDNSRWSVIGSLTILDASIPIPIPQQSPTFNRKPVLKWYAVPIDSPKYSIQIAQAADFAAPLITFPTKDTFFVPTVDLPLGQIYWRIKTESSTWSSTGSFTIEDDRIPVLVSFEDPTRERKPTLRWFKPPRTIASFTIQVSTASSFSTVLTQLSVTDTFFTPTVDLPEGPIYWHVKSDDSRYSPTGNFTIVADSIPFLVRFRGMEMTDTKPKFCWYSVKSATSYKILVANNAGFTNAITIPQADTFYLPSVGLEQGKWYWKVSCSRDLNLYSMVDSLVIKSPAAVVEQSTRGGARTRFVQKKSAVHIAVCQAMRSGRLIVNDVKGRVVATRNITAGTAETSWDYRDNSNNRVPSGIYVLRLTGDNVSFTSAIAVQW